MTKLPGLPSLRCPCGQKLSVGFPLAGTARLNLTACPDCERTFTLDVDMTLEEVDIERMDGEEQRRAMQALNLCRSIQGRHAR